MQSARYYKRKLEDGHVIARLQRRLKQHFRSRREQKRRTAFVMNRLKAAPVNSLSTSQETVLFFSPEAGFKVSSVVQSVLARILQETGHSVRVVRCFGLFERCPVFDMHSLPYVAPAKAKTKICVDCAATSFEMFDAYGLEALDLKTVLTAELQSKYEQACASFPDDLASFEYDSIPFGKLCLHDLVLATKFSDFDQLRQKFRAGWEAYIKTSLLSFLLVDRICEEHSISRLLYVSNYSLQFGAHFAARKHNLPAYSLSLASHQGVDYRRYIVLPELIWPSLFRQGKAWPAWRNLALSEQQVEGIGDDILARMGARSSHVYSPPKNVHVKDIRLELGLSTERRLVVAYTSSLDELKALGPLKECIELPTNEFKQPFTDQIDWLQHVVDFIGTRDDLQLVVRVHPREGANKRDSITSQHLQMLQQTFGHDIPNCRFVWPEEPISSYDLGEAADLVLTSGSTIGLELARLGAPVLTSASGDTPTPHDDFREFGETVADFFNKFQALLERPASIEIIARAFRWYNLFHLGTSVDLGDLIPSHDSTELPAFKMPAEAQTIESIIIGGKHPIELNYERLERAQAPERKVQELQAIRAQLRRVIHFLHTGLDSTEAVPLFLLPGIETNGTGQILTPPDGARTIILMGNHTHYSAGGKTYSRYSPICARLASVCAESIEEVNEAELQMAPANA